MDDDQQQQITPRQQNRMAIRNKKSMYSRTQAIPNLQLSQSSNYYMPKNYTKNQANTERHIRQCTENLVNSNSTSSLKTDIHKLNSTVEEPNQYVGSKFEFIQFLHNFVDIKFQNTDNDPLFQSIRQSLKYIQMLENSLRMSKKQLKEGELMNSFQQIAIKQKNEIFQKVVQENILLKQTISRLEQEINLLKKKLQDYKTEVNFITPPIQRTTSPKINISSSDYNSINKNQIQISEPSEAESPAAMMTLTADNTPSQRLIVINNCNPPALNVGPASQQLRQSVSQKLQKQQSFMQSQDCKSRLSYNFKSPHFIDCSPNNMMRKSVVKKDTMTKQDSQANKKHEFMQQLIDFSFFSQLLDVEKGDQHILDEYGKLKQMKYLIGNMKSEFHFQNFMINIQQSMIQNVYENLSFITKLNLNLIMIILKMKEIVKNQLQLNHSMVLSDSFDFIINLTCKVLACDRTSVFLIDSRRNELITKVQKGTGTIRLKMEEGIVGKVAQTGEMVNILDAYKDPRFNSEFDKKNQFRTKTILCTPIFDQDGHQIIGILQAINKENDQFFKKEDEGLIKILAMQSQIVLRNSMYFDEKMKFHNALRAMLRIGIELNQCRTIASLLTKAELLIEDNFYTEESRLYILDMKVNKFIRYSKQQERQEYDVDIGIVGEVFASGNACSVVSCYKHTSYNQKIDIATQLPILCFPIKEPIKGQKIGVLQLINPNGLESILFSNQSNQSQKYVNEQYDNFCLILAQCIQNLVYHHRRTTQLLQNTSQINQNMSLSIGDNIDIVPEVSDDESQ